MSERESVVIADFGGPEEAHLAKARLEAGGIREFLLGLSGGAN